MVIRRTTLASEEPASDDTPAQRVALAYALTRAAWAMTRQPWPPAGAARTLVRFIPGRAG